MSELLVWSRFYRLAPVFLGLLTSDVFLQAALGQTGIIEVVIFGGEELFLVEIWVWSRFRDLAWSSLLGSVLERFR